MDYFFGVVKSAKNPDQDKCVYSGYCNGFSSRSAFSLTVSNVGKNVIIFGVDMNTFVHVDNKAKHILILSKGPTHRLDNTTLTAEG